MQTARLTPTELQKFRDLMTEHGLANQIPRVEAHLERCLLLEITEPDDYQQVGNTRRCGWPDFPPDWTWPLSEQGQYLNFLCQINLEEIAAYQDVLPRRGLLYFFLGGYEYEAEGRILFYDGDLHLLQKFMLPEPVSVNQFSLGFRPDFDQMDDSFLLHHYPRRVIFHPSLSIPDIDSRILTDDDGVALGESLSFEEQEDYSEVREHLMNPPGIYKEPPPGFHKPSIHQRLFGYEYCQTFEPRDFGQYPCEGPQVGVELFCIWDHDEFFRTCLDGSIIFAVRQDELKHCQFSEIFTALEG